MIGRRAKGPAQPREASLSSRLNVLIGDRKRTVVALAGVSLISGFAEAASLAIIAEIATELLGHSKHVKLQTGFLHVGGGFNRLILIALALSLLRLALQWPISTLPARIAADVQSTLRVKLFRAFTSASWEVQSRDREGQLQDTMTSQTMQATGGAMGATNLLTNGLNFFAMLATAFLLNAVAAGAILVTGIAMFLIVRPIRKISVRRARALSQAQVRFASGVNEAIRLAEETHVFGTAAAQRRRIEELVARSRRLLYETQVLTKLVPNLFQSLIMTMLVVGIWVIYESGVRSPSIAAIILLLVRSARSGQQSIATFQGLAQSLPFIERTQEAERRYAESSAPQGDVPLERVQTLSFQDVAYGYRPDRPVLNGVSFEVTRGEVVGIIGPTGAGKSTLIQILLQLRNPQRGAYLVNGVPAERIVQADWHGRVVYVPQEPRLLHATVADNIRFDREIELAEVERAAKLAHIHDEIVTWEKGYETLVGPRADAVSGGQQQRICLARALAATPEVLVLDEPTSALDPRSEARIQESLTALKSELTLFIIAHRMSTLDICDRIMVVLDGKLAAFDTLDRLRENNAYYRSATALAAGAQR